MAHVTKFKKASCGQMFSHYDRQKDNYGNENIDKDRTHLNYNLATHQKMQQGDFIKKRCSQVRMQNRADVNVMCSWVVTAPKDLKAEEHKKFFEETYNFLQKRYGHENVISAWVHNDEVTPHLHYAFVPVVEDKKREGYKVSAKEAVNRTDLKNFHKDLNSHLERSLGHEVSILNEATKDGNKSIEELKRLSATERLQEVNRRAFKIVSNAKQEAGMVEVSYQAKKEFIKECDKASEVSMSMPAYAKVKKTALGKETVTVPIDKWKAKHVSANEKTYLEKAIDKFDNNIKEFENSKTGKDLLEMENKIDSQAHKIQEQQSKYSSLHKNMIAADKIIKTIKKEMASMPPGFISMFSNRLNSNSNQEYQMTARALGMSDKKKTLEQKLKENAKSNLSNLAGDDIER